MFPQWPLHRITFGRIMYAASIWAPYFYRNITSLLMDFAHFVNCITLSFVLKCTQVEIGGISFNLNTARPGRTSFGLMYVYDFFSSIQ